MIISDINLMIVAVLSTLIVMFIIPAIPMLLTIRKKLDIAPLSMDMDYIYNPRFQATIFENMGDDLKDSYEIIEIKDRLDSSHIPLFSNKPTIFKSSENLTISEGFEHNSIVSTTGSISVARATTLNALKSNQSIKVAKKSKVTLWIDAVDSVEIEKNSEVNLITAKRVKLHKGATFKRIYAHTIAFYPLNQGDEDKSGESIKYEKFSDSVESEVLYLKDKSTIEAKSEIYSDVICRGRLNIAEGCKIMGSIKTNGKLTIEKNVNIYGNIFSDKDIEIGHHCFVFGNIFSHAYLKIGHNGQMGKYSIPKSIIAIKGIEIAGGTFTHNYILTYGKGVVV